MNQDALVFPQPVPLRSFLSKFTPSRSIPPLPKPTHHQGFDKCDTSTLQSPRFSYPRQLGDTCGLELLSAEDLEDLPPVEHPVVRTHPATGRKNLFVGRHASHIIGQPEAESRKLLRVLTEEAAQPPRTWKHQWQPGDLVIWDNRCVLHRGHEYPHEEPRVMVRTTVAGDAPDNEWAA